MEKKLVPLCNELVCLSDDSKELYLAAPAPRKGKFLYVDRPLTEKEIRYLIGTGYFPWTEEDEAPDRASN